MKLEMLYYGSPWLRRKAKRVEKITDEVRQLVADLIETMDDYDGIGLAATQVGREEAIMITRVPEETPNGERLRGEVQVYINPRILSHSSEGYYWQEGCLSIPGIYVEVPRPKTVEIEAMDLDGNVFTKTLEDFYACNFCHENDHLQGVLMTDRTDAATKKKIKPQLKKLKDKHRR